MPIEIAIKLSPKADASVVVKSEVSLAGQWVALDANVATIEPGKSAVLSIEQDHRFSIEALPPQS